MQYTHGTRFNKYDLIPFIDVFIGRNTLWEPMVMKKCDLELLICSLVYIDIFIVVSKPAGKTFIVLHKVSVIYMPIVLWLNND